MVVQDLAELLDLVVVQVTQEIQAQAVSLALAVGLALQANQAFLVSQDTLAHKAQVSI